jgi:molybdopterin molybdotransferase
VSELRTLLAVEDAQERILALAAPLAGEWVSLDEAVGRALAADVIAQRTLPPWDNSAMDGYAVRSADLARTPVRLRVIESVYAGQLPKKTVGHQECSRIMTGAPLPSGADAVVMQEKTRPVAGDEVEILERVAPRTFVRDAGEDARAGEVLLPRVSSVGIPEAALLMSQGIQQVEVPRRPRVAILATGDELCRADQPPGDGQIVDSNSPSLALAVARSGGLPTRLGIARDSPLEVLEKLESARDFDVVLASAGVSVGEHDFVKEALAKLGVRMDFWKVAIKPGKPLAVGELNRTLFFGLPGNPVSSLVSFELFVRPALLRMLGHANVQPSRCTGRLGVRLQKPAGLTHFVRIIAQWENGELWARPLASQTSGALRSAVGATHLLVFPAASTELKPGDSVELRPLSWLT